MNDTCEGYEATATGGGNDARLLKCRYPATHRGMDICLWDCPLCDQRTNQPACSLCVGRMTCVGNAIRSALTRSRVAKAITAALRKKQPPHIDPQAWERAFGPDYASRILWISPACDAFRVAEDGTAADVDDRQLPLPPQPWLVATPRDIGAVEWERWQQLFADYDIISPIGQWT